MTNRLRILIVEDSEDDAEMVLHWLRREGIEVVWTRVRTEPEMREALARQPWDIVLSDYSMPSFSANAARAVLHEAGLDIPFIIVAGTIGEETAVDALKAGASDFVTKGHLSRLVPAIEREMRDADERRKLRAAEAALLETRERMLFAMDAAGVGTWETDIVSGVAVWSALQERLHGLPAGGFGGTFEAFIEAIHPADRQRVRDQIPRFFAARADSRLEYRVTWPDGSVHWIVQIGRTFCSEAGQPLGAAGIGFDITGEKQLEEQVRQSQKMESIGDLAGGIAHDFNNLLTAIGGYCELLVDRLAADPAALDDLGEIHRAVASAVDLTRQLLAFSRKQLLAPRTVSLNDVVTDLQKMLRRLIEENVQIDLELSPDLDRVYVDPGQVEQVLVNLAVNARDAMPEGGVLTIDTANVWLDDAQVRALEGLCSGPHVVLSVRDTGLGMTADVQARVFEPFFTTKPMGEGTGLGLATVYGIVHQSDGCISVDSEPGVGTTFKLYFPVASGKPLPEPARSRPVSGDLTGTETVLIVEDDARLRALDTRILQRYGYTALVAENAADARRICTEHSGPIDVVLTDVIMPGGSGRTIADWIREHRPETRVVYMSGYADNAIARHGVLEPGTHFLQKPFTPEIMARKIREVLSWS